MSETGQDREHQLLSETVGTILAAARTILPGIRILFGFQVIAVFSPRFQERLSQGEQYVHLAAIALVAVATAGLMAPATDPHRVEPELASRQFIILANRLLTGSLILLMLALCADVYVVASLVTAQRLPSVLLALALCAIFSALWFVLPSHVRRTNRDHWE